MSHPDTEFTRIAQHLGHRRAEIIAAWRTANTRDPALVSGSALPAIQLIDHIPSILDAFEARLVQPSGAGNGADRMGEEAAAAHGLHRWQQGYDLSEVIRELGLLNEVMAGELDSYADLPGVSGSSLSQARHEWARAFTSHVEESSVRYFELQRLEAAGHVEDLEYALHELNDIDRERAERWREIAHDLRGNVQIVSTAAQGLRLGQQHAQRSERFLAMLEHNIGTLRHLLDDVTELTRLRAGHESRQLASLDASPLITGLCDGLRAYALARELYLRCGGPTTLRVTGDAAKVTRIAQNLILNALKYTEKGGVEVSWGMMTDESNRWFLAVTDTGPGFQAGPSAPITAALKEATEIAETVETSKPVLASQEAPSLHRRVSRPSRHQRAGEGIGLSIVKRLTELLDSTVEVESVYGAGTTFRILFPATYNE